jgi:hypothetical protein
LAAQKTVQENQTYHEILIHYLVKLVRAPNYEEMWRQLLVGIDDNKVVATYFEYNRKHALESASLYSLPSKSCMSKPNLTFRVPGDMLTKNLCHLLAAGSTGRQFNTGGTWNFIITSKNLMMTSTPC